MTTQVALSWPWILSLCLQDRPMLLLLIYQAAEANFAIFFTTTGLQSSIMKIFARSNVKHLHLAIHISSVDITGDDKARQKELMESTKLVARGRGKVDSSSPQQDTRIPRKRWQRNHVIPGEQIEPSPAESSSGTIPTSNFSSATPTWPSNDFSGFGKGARACSSS